MKSDKKNILDILALTPMQEGMLFHYLKDTGNDYYFEQLILEVTGEIDVKIFEKAWNAVIQNNEMMRTVFRWEKLEKPAQVVLKRHNPDLCFFDLSTIKEDTGKQNRLEKIKRQDRQAKFDLREVPFRVILCKIADKDYRIIISNHHILYDGWSTGIILKEFFQAYAVPAKGEASLQTAVKPPFGEFIRWYQNRDRDKQKKFWEAYLQGFDSRTELPIKRKDIKPVSEKAAVKEFHCVLEKEIKENLDDFFKERRVTLAAFIYSAWGILLQKYCGSDDVIFGTTVSGRSAPISGIENIVGLFINTLPLRVTTEPGGKIKELVERINDLLPIREKYENTSLVDIKEYSELQNNQELFDSILVLENYPLDHRLMQGNSQLPSLVVESYSITETTPYPLTVSLTIGETIEIRFIFDSLMFENSALPRFASHFTSILAGILENFEKDINRIELLTGEEKQQILVDFNNTGAENPRDKTLHQLFNEQAERTPDHISLIGVHELLDELPIQPIRGNTHISYKELKGKSHQLGQLLNMKGVKPDTVVGIGLERSIAMVIAILGILNAGGAYLPIDADYPEERIKYILADSGANLLITTGNRFEERKNLEVIFLDVSTLPSYHLHLPPAPVTCLAYVIYTSGSTGKPKGVTVNHISIVNTLSALERMYPFTRTDVYLLKTSYLFDVSLAELFGWFLGVEGGGRLAVLGPGAEKDPKMILDTVEKMQVTRINFVPSMFNVLVDRLSPGNTAKLLSLKYIFLAGEVLLPEVVNKFRRWNRVAKLENLYGPTEATIYASRFRLEDWGGSGDIPIGKPLYSATLYILDRGSGMQPVGVPGELAIGGPGLARGYLNQPGLTAEKFVILSHRYYRSRKSYMSYIYRTGDLARWLEDGNVEFLGRIDYQVKIRGFRIELGEIENRLLKNKSIKEAVVTAKEDKDSEKYLCAYIVPRSAEGFGSSMEMAETLKNHLLQVIPDYMVPSFFVVLDKIPLTSNGKVDRRSLPEPAIEKGRKYTAPRNRIEQVMAEIWTRLLNLQPGTVGIDDNFFRMGGHSLKATLLVTRIHKEFNVNIPLADIFGNSTIRALSGYINARDKDLYAPIEPVEKKVYHPLSSAQKRLYILWQMDINSTAYNMPAVFSLTGSLDRDKLQDVSGKLIRRHESLRTTFEMIDAQPVQRTHDQVEFAVEYLLTPGSPGEEEKKIGSRELRNFIRPFDLSHAPLLRIGLIKEENHTHFLMVDMHHIIGDGISTRLLLGEFTALMAGKDLPGLKLQYKDYVQWQNGEPNKEKLTIQGNYFKKQLEGEIPVLDLPTDFTRPGVQRFEGKYTGFTLDQEETAALKTLAQENGATLYMVLLAIYYIFLSKLTNQEDILVGTPTMGRRHADLEKIMGMFVNTLVLRNYPVGEKSYHEFLKETKKRSLEAFENQDYQYEYLVEELTVTRDSSRNPLFDTMFVMQNAGLNIRQLEIPGLKLEFNEFQTLTSKFDLTLIVSEPVEELQITIEYSANLFKEATIKRFIIYFRKVVSTVTGNPAVKIADIEILAEVEKKQILYYFNTTGAEYPRNKTIHDLFEMQVKKTPDHVAMVGPKLRIANRKLQTNSKSQITNKKIQPPMAQQDTDGDYITITYRELNRKSNRLAHLLKEIEKGAQPESVVGIMTERSIEMIAGLLGILRAGKAYLPLDGDYPGERIKLMLEDANTCILLSQSQFIREKNLKDLFKGKIIPLDQLSLSGGKFYEVDNIDKSTDIAYIMYTSGSTGRPRGVLVEHRNVIRLVVNTNYIELTGKTRVLQTGAPVFDAATFEVWGPLLNGGQLVLVNNDIILDPFQLGTALERFKINTLWLTSPLFNQLAREKCEIFSKLEYLLLGGDVLSPGIINLLRKQCKNLEIINGYGPTENTTFSTTFAIEREYQGAIPIGSPIENSTAFIVNRDGGLQPVGVFGELWVGGDGVSRGYLNSVELTAEKFIRTVIGHWSFVFGKSLTANDHSHSPHSPHLPHLPYSPLYRTGDLARWLPDGNIEFLGRIDYQVKIRGFRIELGEIEKHLLKNKSVKEAVVIAREDKNSEKYLCAYIVPPSAGSAGSSMEMAEILKSHLLQVIPGYMVPSFFVVLDKIPLTSNGKVDRCALPEPAWERGRKYTAPRNKTEQILAGIWTRLLNLQPGTVGIDDNFFHLGGHSLKATLLVSRIHKELDVNIPLVEIFRTPTIRSLSSYIKTRVQDLYASIEPVEKKEYYELSSVQKRLYVIGQMDINSTAYNISTALSLKGSPDRDKLQTVSRKLIHRHESLRTSFSIKKDEPVQEIHTEVEFEIENHDSGKRRQARGISGQEARGSSEEPMPGSIINNFIRPFDFAHAPLLRIGLIKAENHQHILMVDMHHIISDGMSLGIIIKEFAAIYTNKGERLPVLNIQYKDYSEWQQKEKQKETLKQQEKYWLGEFPGEIPLLQLPLDFSRPGVQSFAGSSVTFDLGNENTDKLRFAAREQGATLFMGLLSLYTVLLSKITGQEDIVVGTPVAGRRHNDLSGIIGMFVNTLPLRNYLQPGQTFGNFLEHVKKRAGEAFENQDYPFEELVEQAGVTRDSSRNPLFDVMFAWQNQDLRELHTLDMPGLVLETYDYEIDKSKFDMTLTGVEKSDNIYFTLTYNSDLFAKKTIRRFAGYFKCLAAVALESPLKKLGQIDILPTEEKSQLLYDFNTTTAEYPGEKTIHLLFEEQVEKIPDHIVSVGHRSTHEKYRKGEPPVIKEKGVISISYKALNQKANRLARQLRQKGIKPDTIAGIMIEPTLQMIIGILAILKAGGSYLPLDPRQPAERIKYMLNDSQAPALLTSRQLARILPPGKDWGQQRVYLDETSVYRGEGTNLEMVGRPQDVIYTIYTSGTTGKSKGTLIENKNLVNYIHWFRKKVHLTGSDRTVLTSSFAFDLGYTIIYSSLLWGCPLHIVPREKYLSPENFLDYIQRHRVTYIKITPSLFSTLVNSHKFSIETCKHLRLVLLGGEAVKLFDIEKAHAIGPHMEIMNHYGPTEATIGCVARFVDFSQWDRYKKNPGIGTPIDNMKAVILDRGLNLVPVGTAGELCVSGAGITRGYLNQPELTAEKFDHDLWGGWHPQPIHGQPGVVLSGTSSQKFAEKTKFQKVLLKRVPPGRRRQKLYKTGDLTRWTVGGDIEFLGRIDSQVKIRGYRVETGEIQGLLLKHKAVKDTVVIPLSNSSGDKYLCAYIVGNAGKTMDPPVLQSKLNEYLAEKLPDYMVPSYFVTVDRIPLTPNGKLNRKLLPEPGTKVESGGEAPRDAVESKLVEIWTGVLSPGSLHPSIGIDDNFFHRGGHSLMAIILVSRIHKVFQVNIPLAEIFEKPTIRGISAYIKTRTIERFTSIEPVEKRNYYMLSSAQKRLYILQQMDESSTGYNMPVVIELEGEIDNEKLKEVFLKLTYRHESLRISFHMVNDAPVQRIHDRVEFAIEYFLATEGPGRKNHKLQNTNYKQTQNSKLQIPNKTGTFGQLLDAPGKKPPLRLARNTNTIIKDFIRPFDLSHAPLLRVGLIKVESHIHILIVDIHHIIGDGISRRLLLEEFTVLMAGKDLPGLKLQYKEYAQWQNRETNKDILRRQKDYWKKQLGGEIPVLDLPVDFTRPEVQRFEGKHIRFQLDQEKTAAVNTLAQESGVTRYMVLLAIYYIFLSKLTNQEDILVGTPTVGRRHADLEKIMGMFVNTLVLRNYPNGEKTYNKFLKEIKEKSLEAFENQDYQYENLVEELKVSRDASRNPLFDTMFVMQDAGFSIRPLEIPGLKLEFNEFQNLTSKFDLTFIVSEPAEEIQITIEYSTNLFKEAAVKRFIIYFRKVVSTVMRNPAVKIADIEILAEAEKKQILYDFNITGVEYPRNKTMQDLFEDQVKRTPDRLALAGSKCTALRTNFSDPFGEVVSITYTELDEKSGWLARYLLENGVKPGEPVGIMVERSIEMIAAILGILKAGCPYVPLNPKAPGPRINYLFTDSGVKIVLSDRNDPGTGQCPVPVFDLAGAIQQGAWNRKSERTGTGRCPVPTGLLAASIAYIIYTSGSTGNPKGVPVTHANFSPLVHWGYRHLGIGPADRLVQNLSYYFDWSVWEIFIALTSGASLYMVPGEVVPDAERYLDFIQRFAITVLHITPTHFQSLLHVSPGQRLNTLRYLCIGAEKLSCDLVERSYAWIPGDCRVFNMYGPTEATIMAAVLEIDKAKLPGYKELSGVPIGKNLGNNFLLVLDRHLHPCPLFVPGELYIGGDGIAPGYLNNPELAFERFIRAHELPELTPIIIFNKNILREVQEGGFLEKISPGRRRLYKTGDLARWLSDGTVEFLGRMDQQVKIRGFRIEPGEIEKHLLEHREVKDALVTAGEYKNGDKYLCAYVVPRPGCSSQFSNTLKEYLSGRLPDYMVPAYFVMLNKMPLNPNGKVDLKALPGPVVTSVKGYMAPGNDRERVLVDIWAGVLGIDAADIGIDDNFFQVGGHSLKATLLVSRIHKEFNVNIPLVEIFRTPTVRGLSGYIKTRTIERYTSIEPVEDRDYYMLSSAQKRLYILQQMDENSTGYNMPVAVEPEDEIDKGKLEEVFLKLINRHGSLRTSFHIVNGEPVQRIHDRVEFAIEYFFTPGDFIRPFDLSHVPLLRAGLIKTGDRSHILMVDMHHIIGDGISRRLLLEEFTALIAGKDLPVLKLQYKDYAQWQNRRTNKEEPTEQGNYFKKQLEGEIPVLDLPADFTRPKMQRFEGKHTGFELDQEETAALNTLAQESGATLYMVLLAIYYIFLSKLTNQEDILVGTPTMGRRHADLEKIMGMFVNTLVLRNYPLGEKTYNEFLKEIKERSLEAFENQDYQYEELVEVLNVTRDASRNPLFDTMFVMQNIGFGSELMEIPGMKPVSHEYLTSKFDLTLLVSEPADGLQVTVEYSTNLFKETTIKRFIIYFKKVVSTIIRNPVVKIADIEILAEVEKKQVLYDFNNTVRDYPRDKTLHRLFEEQVERTPDHAALAIPNAVSPVPAREDENAYLTYRELNRKANPLARLLRAKGVQPDHQVGILVERSVEMIVGILGILKAGGAYLPIDTTYPEERKKWILEDSQTRVLLTRGHWINNHKEILKHLTLEEILTIDDEGIYAGEVSNPETVNKPSDLAYTLYTSGTTGTPKGVMVEHKGVVNYICWAIKKYIKGETVSFPLYTSISFDLTVTSIFAPLLSGNSIVIYGEEENEDVIEKIIVENRARVVKLTPAHLKILRYKMISGADLGQQPGPGKTSSLKRFILGGEELETTLALDIHRHFGGNIEIYNEYGPTETVVGCMIYRFYPDKAHHSSVPLGIPVENTQIYLLDKYRMPVPPGVPGEIYVGGDGVARGYLGREALTAEKFLENPFIKGGRLYKTGDMAKRWPDGDIEFLGRFDSQVKIRGYRIELGEIESHLSGFKDIRDAVVIIREDKESEKYLCAYIVPAFTDGDRTGIDLSEIKTYLSMKLPPYMIPDRFIPIPALPLTPNGKVDRRALPEPGIEKDRSNIPPQTPLQEKLAEIWADVLSLPKDYIGIDSNFFDLGGHSLKATLIFARIHKELDVKVPLTQIFKQPTIRDLSRYLNSPGKDRYVGIKPVKTKPFYSLSSPQKRLYIIQHMEENNVNYNIFTAVVLKGRVNKGNLEKSFRELIKRHENLRTSFHMKEGQPVQKIHKASNIEFTLEFCEIAEKTQGFSSEQREVTGIIHRFIRPFNLEQAPLLRVGLVKVKNNRHIMLVDMHHIISDGTSAVICIKDLVRLYSGELLPPLPLHYKDYSEWQTGEKSREWMKKQEAYWLKEFAGDIPVLNIPLDYPRPPVQRFEGKILNFEIDRQETGTLNSYARDAGASLFMLLFSFCTILMAKICHQEEIVIGIPIAGRRHADLENIMGMFVNTLALKSGPQNDKFYSSFLEEVREKTLGAYENQEYQFEDLVEKLVKKRDASRNPLFDVLFVLQNIDFVEVRVPGLTVEPYPYKSNISQFDLYFMAIEEEDRLVFNVGYRVDLFKQETVERFIRYFKEIAAYVPQHKDRELRLKDIQISHDLIDREIYIPDKNFDF